ncbi:bifunctional isocitrate dehydrogenase kinase/phosphatase [Litorilituus sediminis]|nr:bifunctional isocitrate dehydrogenase kinase/phosphatase [Litorilituus sediminis]
MNNLAYALAKTILNGFERHIQLFIEITQSAKYRFEQCQWSEVQKAARDRTTFYDQRVNETFNTIKQDFFISELDDELWQQVKRNYIDLLSQHKQPELAETFYNSVFCRLFERKYYHNAFIFVESTASRLDEQQAPKIYNQYCPAEKGLKQTIVEIMEAHKTEIPYQDLDADVETLIRAFRKQAHKTRYKLEELSFDILNFTFYRNKGAYIIGRVLSPGGETPFIVSVLNNEQGGLYIDALLTTSESMAVVFGFARAYFFVDCQHPHALVNFLQSLIPHKTKADLYSAIGFHKQGKTQFYRDFLNHLASSNDSFELAAGIKGMVMSVFTLPSYPYVFKIIKDKFSPSKNMTKKDVKGKYRLVKLHDRVGRMADTMEYSEVAFPKDRFSDELLAELEKVAPSIIRYEDDLIIIEHLYIERRMIPLNLYLADALKNKDTEKINEAMYGYGEAIKQLISADIFPGDMLLKNFGVTRHGRVIFYDYDEITYMNEVNFRVKPEPVTEEQIYAAEPWYSVEPGDMFPEELATFALANPAYLKAFKLHHSDLLEASYWQQCQTNVANGIFKDVYPYPDQFRFCYLRGIKKAAPY